MSNENRSNVIKTLGVAFAGFAAGALVTLLGIRTGAELSPTDAAGLAGTMIVRGGNIVGQDIAQLRLDGSDVTGSVAFAQHESMVTAEFDINSPEPIEVRLDLPDAGVAFGGVAQVAGKPLPPAIVQEGSISMMSKGERHFAVFLNQNSTDAKTVKVTFLHAGTVVRQETIDLPAKIRG